MRTAFLNPLQANLFSIFLNAGKIILLLLVVLYGVYHFTLFHWVMVSMFALAVLAISARVSGIKATSYSDATVKPNVILSDGGSFRQVEQAKSRHAAPPVVYDGGIVKSRKPVSNRE
jgi:hypothetical protein